MKTLPTRVARAVGAALGASAAIALSVLGAAFVAATPCHATEPAVRILPLGDSLTSGVSFYPVQGAYRNSLYTQLTNLGYPVDFLGTFNDSSNPSLPDTDHQGQGGARIDQLNSSLDGWLESIDDPDVVLLLAGTNDFWQEYNLASIESRYTTLIEHIATVRPFAKIIVATLPKRTDDPAIEAQQASFNSSISSIVSSQAALGRQISLVDLHPAITSSDLSPDGVHPTAAGFAKLATVWKNGVTSEISPAGTDNPPVIARIEPITDLQQVSVTFSKPIADSAANPAHFTPSAGLTINNATLDATKRVITLDTSTQTPGIVYSLSVTGVRDRTAGQHLIAPQSMATFASGSIVNGSFENDTEGWSATGNYDIKTEPGYDASDGTQLIAFNSAETTPNATLSQTFTTYPGNTYQLSFDMGVYGFSTAQQRLGFTIQGNATHLYAESTLSGIGGGNTIWQEKSYNFVADSATTTITFSDLSATTSSLDLVIDNVRIGAQETGSLAITSSPLPGASVTVDTPDIAGNSGGSTGLLRTYNPGQSITITAPSSFNGAAFLGWRKNGADQPGSATTITVTMDGNIAIDAVYEDTSPPLAADDNFTTPSGTTLVVAAPGLLANDTDPADNPLSAVLDTAPLHGSVTLNPDGGFSYTPPAAFTGTDSFTYHAENASAASPSATVHINVYQSSSALLANGGFENDFTGWTVTGNSFTQSSSPYTPTEGLTLAVFNAGQSTPNGSVSQSFATVPGESYQLTFDMGALAFNTAQQHLNVIVSGTQVLLNTTPSIQGVGGGNSNWISLSYTFVADSETTTLALADVSSTTTNIDLLLDNVRIIGQAPTRTLTVSSSTPGALITVAPDDIDGYGTGTADFTRNYAKDTEVSLTAPAGIGASVFSKWLKDGADFASTPAITVTLDSDHALTAVYTANTQLLANGSFENGYDQWTHTGAQLISTYNSPTDGSQLVELNGSQLDASAVLSQAFPTIPGETYQLTFDYGILAFNTSSQSLRVDVAGTGTGSVLSHTLTYQGTASGTAEWHSHTFTFVADDTSSTLTFTDLSPATVNIDSLLDNVRVAATSSQRILTVSSAVAGSVAITVTPQDLAGNTDGITAFTRDYPNQTTVNLTAPAVAGTTYFVKWQQDGTDFSTTPAVSVTMDADHTLTAVYRTNQAPACTDDSYSATSGIALEIPAPGVLANDSDDDDDPLTASVESSPANGVLELAADGGFTYTPAPQFSGTDSFAYRVSDGFTTTVATVQITVAEPPVPIDSVTASISGSPGNLTIQTTPLTPGSYTLQTSTDLVTWSFHSSVVLTATGPAEFTDTEPSTPRKFYRIHREQISE